jgi:hypothetical protein
MNKKTLSLIGIILVILGVVLFIVGIMVSKNKPSGNENATSTDETSGWFSYTDIEGRYEIKYPETFGANVWHANKWPPKVYILTSTQNPEWDLCPNETNTEEKQVKINGYDFKVFKNSDIGAGSMYTTYCYTTQIEKSTYTVLFSIWSAAGCGQGNCGPYCDTPNEEECKTLDRTKEMDEPIEKIMSTFKIFKTDPFSSIDTSDWKKYVGNEFSFNYPSYLSLKEKAPKILLSHSIPYVHEDLCNMKNPQELKEMLDFDVSMDMVDKNLKDTVDLDNLEIKYMADVSIDLKDKGTINGYRFESQVESCGEWLYYFPISENKTLRIAKSLISEFRPFFCGEDCDKLVASLSNAISPIKEEIIFNKILSSLIFAD